MRVQVPGAVAAVVTVILVALAVTPPLLGAAPGGGTTNPDQFVPLVYQDLYLPLLMRSAQVEDLPPATAVTMTPSPTLPPTDTPTPAPTFTSSPSPTVTETPPPTPTWAPGGEIRGRLLVDGEPAQIGLGLPFGPALYLNVCSAGACEIADRTGVEDEQGTYIFKEPPRLAEGEYYQVVWYNENNPPVMLGNDQWLGSWYGPRITELTGGEIIQGGDLEIADLVLVKPTHGTGFSGWPIVFGWQRRKHEVGSYRWGICDCCQNLQQRKQAWLTQSLGQQTEFELDFYPPGTELNEKYCWFVRIQSEDGYGESYHIRMMWFFFAWDELARFGLVDPDEWGAVVGLCRDGLRIRSSR